MQARCNLAQTHLFRDRKSDEKQSSSWLKSESGLKSSPADEKGEREVNRNWWIEKYRTQVVNQFGSELWGCIRKKITQSINQTVFHQRKNCFGLDSIYRHQSWLGKLRFLDDFVFMHEAPLKPLSNLDLFSQKRSLSGVNKMLWLRREALKLLTKESFIKVE